MQDPAVETSYGQPDPGAKRRTWQKCLPNPGALVRRRRLESVFESIFTISGFTEIAVPLVDFESELPGVAARYRMLDSDGEVLNVRSDFTPFVFRAIAGLSSPPRRIWYRGEVIGREHATLAGGADSWEMGAELIGNRSGDDLEIIRLALAVMKAAGIPSRIEVSDVRFVGALIDESDLTTDLGNAVRKSLATKNGAQLSALRETLPCSTFQLLEALRTGTISRSELTGESGKIAGQLELLRENTSPESVEIHLDDVWEPASYYSALRFRIVAHDGTVLGSGGRYVLPGNKGPLAGVGFKIGMDRLERIAGRIR